MPTLIEMPLKKYPRNIDTFMMAANAALTIRLMTMMATVGLESRQICFGDSEHLARVAIFLIRKLEPIGGERRGCDSDDSTELMDTLAQSIIF